MEVKQFAFSYSETVKFGSQSIINQSNVVRASVPNGLLNKICNIGVDPSIVRSGTITVYGNYINQFNNAVSSTIKIMP